MPGTSLTTAQQSTPSRLRAMGNEDVALAQMLASAVRPGDLQQLGLRLRIVAAQASIANRRAATVADGPLADRQ